jgi:hypothetical protein
MTNRLYCSECKHCRPERSLRTVWGVRVEASMQRSRCANRSERVSITKANMDYWGVWEDPRYPLCVEVRTPGMECPQFLPATPAAEAKQTMMKLAGEPNAVLGQPYQGQIYTQQPYTITVGTSSGGGK